MPCEALPVELEQHILSYLKDDIRSLRACALTCHRWVYSTQKHLFARVLLDFRHVPFPSQANPPDRFCQLLLSSPRISAYVRELSIVIAHGMEDQDLHRLTDILQVCLPLLAHLRGINLGRGSITNSSISTSTTSTTSTTSNVISSPSDNPGIRPNRGYIWPVSWHFIPSVVRNELRTAFRSQSLVNIRLAHMRGIPLSVLALAGCPRLEGLFLEDVTFGGVLQDGTSGAASPTQAEWAVRPPSKDRVLQGQRRPLKVLRLELAEPALQTFAQWATSVDCPLDISTVQTLSVTMPRQYSTHAAINALLDECAGALRTFCCRLEIQAIGVGLDAVTYPLDIRALHNLRTLRLAVGRRRSKPIFHNYRQYIPNILTQLEPAGHRALEEVSVKLDAAEWKETAVGASAGVCEIAQRVRAHLVPREGECEYEREEFVALRKVRWVVAGTPGLRAALAAGLQAGCTEHCQSNLNLNGGTTEMEITTCDSADSAGFLDGEDEDEENIFGIV